MTGQLDAGIFGDLPQSMVYDMLGRTRDLADDIMQNITQIQDERVRLREELRDRIGLDSEIIRHSSPSVSAVDGAYCVDRLLAVDLVAVSAVAVEGIASKTMNTIWPRPRHLVGVDSVPHHESIPALAQAIMMSMELQLAARAPHEVVMLDGALSTFAISFNTALQHDEPGRLVEWLLRGGRRAQAPDGRGFGPLGDALENYAVLLDGDEQIAAALPKYSRRNEICKSMGMADFDDKGLLSLVLEPGEYTRPAPIERSGGRWLTHKLSGTGAARVERALDGAHVTYYKPNRGFPAVRLEIGGPVAADRARLAVLLEAIKTQFGVPGMIEPYPMFMADRMVKHLPKALPAMRNNAILRTAAGWVGDVGDVILATRGYRT